MKTPTISTKIYQYLQVISPLECRAMQLLREETDKLPQANMQISPDQAHFMSFLATLIGAKNVLELGTFTGISALALALGAGTGSVIKTCDISDQHLALARAHWQLANVDNCIEFVHQRALDYLTKLQATKISPLFDLIFIDADKGNYLLYYEQSLSLLRAGGVMMIDNIFLQGKVLDTRCTSTSANIINALNLKIQADSRVTYTILAIADGLTLVRKC